VRAAMRASLKPQMIMMCVTSLVTASKERQTGAKSCKAGKLHNADGIHSVLPEVP